MVRETKSDYGCRSVVEIEWSAGMPSQWWCASNLHVDCIDVAVFEVAADHSFAQCDDLVFVLPDVNLGLGCSAS